MSVQPSNRPNLTDQGTTDYQIRKKTIKGQDQDVTIYEVDSKLKQTWLKSLSSLGLREKPEYLTTSEIKTLSSQDKLFANVPTENRKLIHLASISLRKELNSTDDPAKVLSHYSRNVQLHMIDDIMISKKFANTLGKEKGANLKYNQDAHDNLQGTIEQFHKMGMNFETGGLENFERVGNSLLKPEDPSEILQSFNKPLKEKLLANSLNETSLIILNEFCNENPTTDEKLSILVRFGFNVGTGKVENAETFIDMLVEQYHPNLSKEKATDIVGAFAYTVGEPNLKPLKGLIQEGPSKPEPLPSAAPLKAEEPSQKNAPPLAATTPSIDESTIKPEELRRKPRAHAPVANIKPIMNELESTEKTHLDSLKSAIKALDKLSELLPDDTIIKAARSNYHAVHDATENFYAKLNQADKDPKQLGNVYGSGLEFGAYTQTHAHCAKDYETLSKHLSDLRRDNPQTMETFKRYLDSFSSGKSINDFIITPIQRMPRHKLLLEDAIKATPPGSLARASVNSALHRVVISAMKVNKTVDGGASSAEQAQILKLDGLISQISKNRIIGLDNEGKLTTVKRSRIALFQNGRPEAALEELQKQIRDIGEKNAANKQVSIGLMSKLEEKLHPVKTGTVTLPSSNLPPPVQAPSSAKLTRMVNQLQEEIDQKKPRTVTNTDIVNIFLQMNIAEQDKFLSSITEKYPILASQLRERRENPPAA